MKSIWTTVDNLMLKRELSGRSFTEDDLIDDIENEEADINEL